jgi:membrane fusion protein (multidrug efflux system)
VPQRGITRTPAGAASALVVGRDGKVEERVVTADRAIGDAWLVTAGLAAGDRVIVDGLQKVKPGVAVKAVPADAAAADVAAR